MAALRGRNPLRSVVDQGPGGRPRRFFDLVGEVISELGKVTWPSRETTLRLTGFVIAIALAVGIFLGLWDVGFGQVVNRLVF